MVGKSIHDGGEALLCSIRRNPLSLGPADDRHRTSAQLACMPAKHPTSAPCTGLRSLDGQFVTSVRRGDSIIHAVGPEFILAAGDILFLSGESHDPLPVSHLAFQLHTAVPVTLTC